MPPFPLWEFNSTKANNWMERYTTGCKSHEHTLYDQGASTRTLIVPWLLAVSMVGLSLFQQTALMK